ncbi:MAG: 6-phosphogluconolactonase [Myxococcota bacterium]|nr:6-phosphogluconolactonase [Myxococcota bacterium]MDW8362062.1 6-phosphogluconolactonase [Myxococcales bacterium]
MSASVRRVFANLEALAAAAADHFANDMRRAVGERGRYAIALTGSSVVPPVYRALAARRDLPWPSLEVFWGDERAVPPHHPDSNQRMARETLLDAVSIPSSRIHPMIGDADEDLEHAARRYESTLRATLGDPPLLDCVHLGVGPDGHICSLFPSHPASAERRRLVVPVFDAPKAPPRRLTFTMSVLEHARSLWFFVTGESKAAVVRAALEDPASALPVAVAARRARAALWYLDEAAASLL